MIVSGQQEKPIPVRIGFLAAIATFTGLSLGAVLGGAALFYGYTTNEPLAYYPLMIGSGVLVVLIIHWFLTAR